MLLKQSFYSNFHPYLINNYIKIAYKFIILLINFIILYLNKLKLIILINKYILAHTIENIKSCYLNKKKCAITLFIKLGTLFYLLFKKLL